MPKNQTIGQADRLTDKALGVGKWGVTKYCSYLQKKMPELLLLVSWKIMRIMRTESDIMIMYTGDYNDDIDIQ